MISKLADLYKKFFSKKKKVKKNKNKNDDDDQHIYPLY